MMRRHALRALGTTLALALLATGATARTDPKPTGWTADNGDGTFTNPLFFDEFSDPDLIRVGDDFYLTGTTMHAMPGLPVLHSRDLVNWTFESYAMDRLDLGPAYRLEGGQNVYGKGIWAPSFRYRDGIFYIFSNVNGQTTQMFTARSPKGPWTRTAMKRSFHDLSVLFDDDGKAWVIWGYQDIHLAELDARLTDIVPGSERIIIAKGAGMGEGSHLYKIDGRYYITSAEWSGPFRMPAARADRITGPWEVNPAISRDEDFGETAGYRVGGTTPPFRLTPPNPAARGGLSLHQGGIVRTPAGEWWGWSMFEGNSVGRLTALSPVTWKDGWPWFGLPGNLGRTPRTWVKPRLPVQPIVAPYRRSDSFDAAVLQPIWQWNHVPDDRHWSLTARPGALRLTALPAGDILQARNTLTQRAVGPVSVATVEIDGAGLKPGDVAGLALLNRPYGWAGLARDASGLALMLRDEQRAAPLRQPIAATHLWLQVAADFRSEKAQYRWSTDGRHFTDLGSPVTMAYQLMTFQGVRYGLFAFNRDGRTGGVADMLDVTIAEPLAESRPAIPYDRTVRLRPVGAPAAGEGFRVVGLGLGRVALLRGDRALTVAADGATRLAPRADGPAQSFQWMESLSGGAMLMSLATHRYLRATGDGLWRADSPGATADNRDRSRLDWR